MEPEIKGKSDCCDRISKWDFDFANSKSIFEYSIVYFHTLQLPLVFPFRFNIQNEKNQL